MTTQPLHNMAHWHRYFEGNLSGRDNWNDVTELTLDRENREPLIRSLQRFQVGESGEGNNLKKCAASLGDEDYSAAIALFIAEEGEHARLLSRTLQMLDAPLLQGHWSDALFVIIRRLGGGGRRGLRLELMILLVAEMIAKRYYRALYEGVECGVMRRMCAQILRDEVGHVAFHCDYLRGDFAQLPQVPRGLARGAWRAFFRVVCLIVALDHRSALRACGVSTRDWWRDCNAIFDCTTTRIFAPKRSAANATPPRASTSRATKAHAVSPPRISSVR